MRTTFDQEIEILNKTNKLTEEEQDIKDRYYFNAILGIEKPITDENADEYKELLGIFMGNKLNKLKRLDSLLRPLNEQKILYDESFEEEQFLKLNTGEQIAFQAITNDILKRFINTDDITLDTLQQYPIKWDEIDEIKKDCVDNSIYFKHEDVIRASFGKHTSRRKNDDITTKTFLESINVLLKMYDIKISQANRVTVKGKQYSNYMISVNNDIFGDINKVNKNSRVFNE